MADERQLSVLARQVRRVREFVEHDGVDSAQRDMIRQFRSVSEDPSLRAALLISSTGTVLAANPPELAGMSAADALRKAGEPADLAAEIEQTRKPGGSHSRVEGSRAIVFSPVDHSEDRPVLLAIPLPRCRPQASPRAGRRRDCHDRARPPRARRRALALARARPEPADP